MRKSLDTVGGIKDDGVVYVLRLECGQLCDNSE